MNLKKLSNKDLDQKNISLAQQERELLHVVLEHIKETDQRKLFLELGYQSLFAYLTERCGHSANGAQRRIDAARLLAAVPDLGHKIETGEINLSHTSIIQKSIRQKFRELKSADNQSISDHQNTGDHQSSADNQSAGDHSISKPQHLKKASISAEQKREIVAQVLGKTAAQSQAIVARSLDLVLTVSPKETYQKDESVKLEVTFTKGQWAKLNEMRDLLSNAVHSNCWTDVFEYLSDKVIKQKKGQTKTRIHCNNTVEVATNEKSNIQCKKIADSNDTNTNLVVNSQKFCDPIVSSQNHPPTNNTSINIRSHIPISTKRLVFQRDRGCQYKDKYTGKVCGSRWNLQFDHWQPIWAGGSNEIDNLQLLCGPHNRLRYKKQTNIRPS